MRAYLQNFNWNFFSFHRQEVCEEERVKDKKEKLFKRFSRVPQNQFKAKENSDKEFSYENIESLG
jgi:hypothetical protein